MGTTLTGTTPQDTYDSLIKVTDNGPISGTAKYLSDGLGNDSVLALSTSRVGIGTTSLQAQLHIDGTTAESSFIMERDTVAANSVIGQIKFTNNNGTTTYGTLLGGRNAAGDGYSALGTGVGTNLYAVEGGNVGIGTSSPDQKLNIAGSQATAYATSSVSEVVPLGGVNMTMQNTAAGGFTSMRFVSLNGSNAIGYLGFTNTTASIGGAFVFGQRSGGGYAEQVRIQEGGGISFNGDTAAANALDDYEEGTWTPVFTMGTSGTIVTGGVSGRYTKVGNLVTCTGFANVNSVSSPVGELRVGGLPFTTGTASDSGMSLFAYGFANTTAVSTYQGFISEGLTYAIVRGFSNGDQVQNIGANVVGSAGIIFTITYRV